VPAPHGLTSGFAFGESYREAMRALSLWQPVASLIAHGEITVETRSWSTTPGPLLIAAGKSRKGMEWCHYPAFAQAMKRCGLVEAELPLGVVVAQVEVLEVRSTDDWQPEPGSKTDRLGDFSPGLYAFILGNVQRLREPVALTGYQKVFTVPEETAQAVQAALARS
jgi:hypothetical protein